MLFQDYLGFSTIKNIFQEKSYLICGLQIILGGDSVY